MRGTDFRSERIMTLLICRGFGTLRELHQALHRVGRLTDRDRCWRYCMHGVSPVDFSIRQKQIQGLLAFLQSRELEPVKSHRASRAARQTDEKSIDDKNDKKSITAKKEKKDKKDNKKSKSIKH